MGLSFCISTTMLPPWKCPCMIPYCPSFLFISSACKKTSLMNLLFLLFLINEKNEGPLITPVLTWYNPFFVFLMRGFPFFLRIGSKIYTHYPTILLLLASSFVKTKYRIWSQLKASKHYSTITSKSFVSRWASMLSLSHTKKTRS